MSQTTYDTDFFAWTQHQAAALRAKDFAALDLEHLAEEIESLGRSDRRAIASQLERLLLHLLKWAYQPLAHERYGASWRTRHPPGAASYRGPDRGKSQLARLPRRAPGRGLFACPGAGVGANLHPRA